MICENLLIYVIGFFTGIVTGLALGGGAILIPFLVLMMQIEQHVAQGITLVAFLPMSVIAIITHYKQGNISTSLILPLIAGGIIGALGGALLSMICSPNVLTKIYGGFLILMGCYEFFQSKKSS